MSKPSLVVLLRAKKSEVKNADARIVGQRFRLIALYISGHYCLRNTVKVFSYSMRCK